MGGGGSQPTSTTSTVTQSNLPEYARPYFEQMMQRSQAALSTPYQTYGQERIAGFTGQQQQVQNNILNQKTPGQFATASSLGQQAGLAALQAGKYTPGQFGFQQVNPMMQWAPQMGSAQSDYQPDLNYFQMQGPGSFTQQGTAEQYMSPYMQNVLDVQRREAIRGAKQGQLAQDLGAARQGTYGGSRQLLASMERERNLGQQLNDIEATGMQQAYQNAQQQYNTEQGLGQQANIQNLQAALQTQGLGAQYGTQMALANLSNEQQAMVQNQAAILQTQGLNAQQAMQAALANQQYGMDAQKAAEQSRQFGAQQGLAALTQANQSAQTLANIGQMQGQADLARLGQQQTTAAQRQALNQQYLDTAYQDFLRQQGYPMEQLQQFSSLLRGVPVTPSTQATATTMAQQPSLASQIMGTGLGALGMYKSLSGG